MSYHHKSGAQKREKAMRAEGVKGQNTLKQHGFAGADTGFSKKEGLRPAIQNAGGGVSASGPIQKAWGGGGGGGCCPLQARHEKRGGGRGGAACFRPDTTSKGGGVGGGAVRHFRPDTKSGGAV